ncbi:hypothetical protein BDQ17DRAFT_1426358 [Cyathus striatus]|nr:hypothetical protein BDQ17DRAFT_1426358 [Cyathus striatus]
MDVTTTSNSQTDILQPDPKRSKTVADPVINLSLSLDEDTDNDLPVALATFTTSRNTSPTPVTQPVHPVQETLKQASLKSLWEPLRSIPAPEQEALQKRECARVMKEREREHKMEKLRVEKKKEQTKHWHADLDKADELTINDLAEMSHPGKEAWHQEHNGKLGGAKQDHAKQMNWFHPLFWLHIDKVIWKASWSAKLTEMILKCNHPKLFKMITRGTIWKWKEPGKNACAGRSGVLAKYLAIVDEVKMILRDLWTSGIPVNVITGHSTIIAAIKKHQLFLLQAFFQSVMNWSLQQATHAAAHIPPGAPGSCRWAFFHLVYAMKWENVLPALIVNVNQMGMYILPNNSCTYHDKGDKQVDAIAKEEKHAYSLLVAGAAGGDILSFQ